MIFKVKKFTELKNLLKLADLVPSGGVSKHLIKDGEVYLNGEVCTMAGKKLKKGDVVEFEGNKIEVDIDEN